MSVLRVPLTKDYKQNPCIRVEGESMRDAGKSRPIDHLLIVVFEWTSGDWCVCVCVCVCVV